MQLLIMQLSPTTRHFIPLRSKYSPKHPVLKYPKSMFFPMIAKTKKPHTIDETLDISASIRIAEIMFSGKEVVKIKNISHSNDTIRKIDEMAENIIKQSLKKYSEETVCFAT
jgi:hypothetical protein